MGGIESSGSVGGYCGLRGGSPAQPKVTNIVFDERRRGAASICFDVTTWKKLMAGLGAFKTEQLVLTFAVALSILVEKNPGCSGIRKALLSGLRLDDDTMAYEMEDQQKACAALAELEEEALRIAGEHLR